MERALENVGCGIRDALQRVTDARARLATHRTALDESRCVLTRALSPLLRLDPAEAKSPVSSRSRDTSHALLPPLRRGQSANASAAAGISPSHHVFVSVHDLAEGAEDPIIISPAASSWVSASTTAVARGRESPGPPLLELWRPPPVSSAPSLSGTSARVGFYSAMAARTQQLEVQRFHYRQEHAMHTAKLQITQTWVREVQPWFETVVHRTFFKEMVHRLDALDRRVARLCRRMELDRLQYTPTCCCSMQTRRDVEAAAEIVSEVGHLQDCQRCAQWCPPLTGDGGKRRSTDRLCGAHEQAYTGLDDDGEREAVRYCGCTGEVTCLSVLPSQQGGASDPPAEFGSAEGSCHSVCSLWCRYIDVVSQTDALCDEQLQPCERSRHAPLPTKKRPVLLLRTPRSLRHIWHVIMEGFTSSGVAADSGSMAAESITPPPTTDGVAVGDTVPRPGRRPHQLGHNEALMQILSSLVRRYFELHSPPSGPQPTPPLRAHHEHSRKTGYDGDRGGTAGVGRHDASSIVQVGLPSHSGFSTVNLFPSQVCVLLCCTMQLCPLAELRSVSRADPPLEGGTALPQLTHVGEVGVCAEDYTVAADSAFGAEVRHGGSREPVAVPAGTTGRHSMCQRPREEQIAEALSAVYHAVPRLLSELRQAFQKQRGCHEDGSDALPREWGEDQATEVEAPTRPGPCALSAEEDCACMKNSTADAGAVTHGVVDIAPPSTVGGAARDGDAFAQRWLSLFSSLFTTATSPTSPLLIADVPPVYARALRVGPLFRSFADIVEDECGERLTPPTGGAAPALPSPRMPTLLTTAHADASTVVMREIHLAPLSTAVGHRANFIVPTSLPLLSASVRLSSLHQMELQTRQQWQSTETRLSVARSMAAAALQRAASDDSKALRLPD